MDYEEITLSTDLVMDYQQISSGSDPDSSICNSATLNGVGETVQSNFVELL